MLAATSLYTFLFCSLVATHKFTLARSSQWFQSRQVGFLPILRSRSARFVDSARAHAATSASLCAFVLSRSLLSRGGLAYLSPLLAG